MLKPLIAAALIALPLPALALPGAPPALTLRLADAKPQGTVFIAIYADEASWNGGAPARVAMQPAAAAGGSITIEGLAPGRYAVKLYQDVNGNGKMDNNPFGIPIEPFGFSRDAMGAQGSPAWADAAFEVGADGAVQTITLR